MHRRRTSDMAPNKDTVIKPAVSRVRHWVVVGGRGLAGAALTGSGVFASWAATAQATTGSQQAATVGATNTDTNGTVFTSGVGTLLPGDYLYRYANLVNTGDLAQA